MQELLKHDANMNESAIRKRDSLFECRDELQTCVLNVANCNVIRPNHKVKPCQKARMSTDEWIYETHEQSFGNEKLNLLTPGLAPDVSATNMCVDEYFKGVVDLSEELTDQEGNEYFNSSFAEWTRYRILSLSH